MKQILISAAVALALGSTPAVAAMVPMELPEWFECDTDGDCLQKAAALGCVEDEDSPTGFLCEDYDGE